jgi:hypothetical protein
MRKTKAVTLMGGVDYHPESFTLYVNCATYFRRVYRPSVNDQAVYSVLDVWAWVKKAHPDLRITQVVVKGGVG